MSSTRATCIVQNRPKLRPKKRLSSPLHSPKFELKRQLLDKDSISSTAKATTYQKEKPCKVHAEEIVGSSSSSPKKKGLEKNVKRVQSQSQSPKSKLTTPSRSRTNPCSSSNCKSLKKPDLPSSFVLGHPKSDERKFRIPKKTNADKVKGREVPVESRDKSKNYSHSPVPSSSSSTNVKSRDEYERDKAPKHQTSGAAMGLQSHHLLVLDRCPRNISASKSTKETPSPVVASTSASANANTHATFTLSHSPQVTEDDDDAMDWDSSVTAILRMWVEVEGNGTGTVQVQNDFVDDDMEVDVHPSDQLIIVPDTNIWIDSSSLLKQLLDIDFPKVAYPTVVIPWMVLQELDVNMKKRASPLQQKFRLAVKFIHDLLTSKHPRVRGQRAAEVAFAQRNFDELMADDSILQCALQLHQPENTVVFLSNDKNLLNKALVHGVLAFDSSAVVQNIFAVLGHAHGAGGSDYRKELSTSSVCLPFDSQLSQRSYSCESMEIASQPTPTKNDFSHLNEPSSTITPNLTGTELRIQNYSDIVVLMRSAMCYVIETKMKEYYGEKWLTVLKIKPPWTLRSAVTCIIKHWIVVFSFVFSRKGLTSTENLLDAIKDYESDTNSPIKQESLAEAMLTLLNIRSEGEDGTTDFMKNPQVLNCKEALMVYLRAVRP